LLLEGHTEE